MCMIGCQAERGYMMVFKQCDLPKSVKFFEPVIVGGKDGVRYMKFGREGNSGTWCGVNNRGVSLVAADAYMTKSVTLPSTEDIPATPIFEAYCGVLSDFSDAKSAVEYLVGFYRRFPHPDIALIADAKTAYYIEAFNGEVLAVPIEYSHNTCDNRFFNTNHFRFLQGAVSYAENKSTYLRLHRAELLGQTDANIFQILSDQYYGKSVLSLCRDNAITPVGEEPYFTQASAVITTNGEQTNIAYLINGNPKNTKYTLVSDAFGRRDITEYSGYGDLTDRMTRFSAVAI